MNRRRIKIASELLQIVAILGTCAVLIYANSNRIFPRPRGPVLPKELVSLDGATTRGSAAAQVVLVEYSDYQCPFCRTAENDVLPEVTKRYIDSGIVQFAFRQFPLEQLHPGTTRISEAALCARSQGKFWEMHASLFQDSKNANDAGLVERARSLGLDETQFKNCLSGVSALVQQDVSSGRRLGLTGTPAFLVGRRQADGRVKVANLIIGARPVADFAAAIDALTQNEKPASASWFGVTALFVAVVAAASVLWIRRRRVTKASSVSFEGA